MDSVETSGRTVDDAVLQALTRLGKLREDVEIQILQEPVKGSRGIGSRDARVRVWVKHSVTHPDEAESAASNALPGNGVDNRQRSHRTPSIFSEASRTAPKSYVPGPQEDKEEEFEEEQPVRATEDSRPASDTYTRLAADTLREIVKQMGIPCTIEITGRNPLRLNIRLKDTADTQSELIGRGGETLSAMQLLVNLIVNKQNDEHHRILIDIENYRKRRDENLRSLAQRVASQVQKNMRSVMLEPMTPYDRRIIHLTLQDSPYVQTQSTGEGEQRRVVVSLKQTKHES